MNKLYTLLFSLFISLSAANATTAPLPVTYKMYPNPLSGAELQIKFDFDYKIGQVYIFTITNIIGQTTYTHILTEDEVKKGIFTIDTEEIKLDKGIYLTKMVNGDHSSVQKLVVR
ncbi:MAG: T9SS type A sorting domain-containing protein [bacterium]|nr:T9SS type A sorting domain-containing protein [bacterium]